MKTTTSTRLWLKGSIACALAMLALGTGRAIAADASVTAIDILLKPDATMLQHTAATNERLLKVFPKGFALDASHRPHITLGSVSSSPRIWIKSMPPSAKSSPAPM
ncbi:MAG TPA: hypothetical protein VMW56_21560 [Candidatus Margulisiibacteriota bacterium]|nr:hypothetical protein [Candidatus Margulisiibacteriota bacterium]